MSATWGLSIKLEQGKVVLSKPQERHTGGSEPYRRLCAPQSISERGRLACSLPVLPCGVQSDPGGKLWGDPPDHRKQIVWLAYILVHRDMFETLTRERDLQSLGRTPVSQTPVLHLPLWTASHHFKIVSMTVSRFWRKV